MNGSVCGVIANEFFCGFLFGFYWRIVLKVGNGSEAGASGVATRSRRPAFEIAAFALVAFGVQKRSRVRRWFISENSRESVGKEAIPRGRLRGRKGDRRSRNDGRVAELVPGVRRRHRR